MDGRLLLSAVISKKIYALLPIIFSSLLTVLPHTETTAVATIPKNNVNTLIAKEKISRKSVDSIDIPIELEIPKINLKTNIESVGVDPDGLMTVPAEGKTVSWYKYGPKPGELGNAVIAGHYDTKNGPAVFNQLYKLKIGDFINVLDKNGLSESFEIINTEIVNLKNFDVNKVYGNSDNRNLNLITCYGKYNSNLKTYDRRLIIYSKLSDSEPSKTFTDM